MWSPESEINSIAMATTMRHSQSSSSGEFVDKKKWVALGRVHRLNRIQIRFLYWDFGSRGVCAIWRSFLSASVSASNEQL